MSDVRTLKAKHIAFPEYHQVYHLGQLGNFIDYNTRNMDNEARNRLECLMKDMDIHGMIHPIIISYNAYNVSVGHQRLFFLPCQHLLCLYFFSKSCNGNS